MPCHGSVHTLSDCNPKSQDPPGSAEPGLNLTNSLVAYFLVKIFKTNITCHTLSQVILERGTECLLIIFLQINSKTHILRKFFLIFTLSTAFFLMNYRGIKGSFKNHI